MFEYGGEVLPGRGLRPLMPSNQLNMAQSRPLTGENLKGSWGSRIYGERGD